MLQPMIRLRIIELLKERDWTAYRLARESKGRISMSAAYRLSERKGELATYPADLIDALCETLGKKPGDLFEQLPATKRTRTT